jgi:hypothetical protein
MPSIRFDATASEVEGATILRLPATASKKLPSRGQVAVRGTINELEFETVVEPDGRKGHWIQVDERLKAAVKPGDTATIDLEPADEWPEPEVPADLAAALTSAPEAIRRLWEEITPMARWEWVRWVDATKNPATRQKRVEVTISKLDSGKRRPCCFDLSSCTVPELSRNGKLVEPD